MEALEWRWWLGALIGGAGCGLAGFFLLALDLPFLAVCLAHAALAGAVLGQTLGLPVALCAFAAALVTALILGPASDRLRVPTNALSSLLFSGSLGIAFLGIGLAGEGRALSLSLLWGNLLLLDWSRLGASALVTLFGLSVALRYRHLLKAVLFDRRIAWACGLPASKVLYLLIAWCGLTITVNLEALGGLMLYSLLINPAMAARFIVRRFEAALLVSAGLGALSSLTGLGLALQLDWPVGASIVLCSTLLFALAALFRPRVQS